MLNYNDIKERYRLNPEPKEVSEVRRLITDSFSDLEFVEDVHKYYLPINGKKIELPSVSSVIEQWVPKVNWDEKAEMKAIKLGITKDEMLKQWHETNIRSTSNGSQTHFFGENCMNLFIGREDKVKRDMTFQYTNDGYLIPYAPKEDAVTKYYEDILSNPDIYPVMPEAKVHTAYVNGVKNPYAGTFDILMAYRYKGRIVFSIHDFKGLPLDTPILTNNGFVNMGDLKRGDVVYDKNGNQTKIINCSNIHYNKCMKINFDDNTSIISDFEHRWEITFTKCVGVDNLTVEVMTTQELFDYVKKINEEGRTHRNIPKIIINKQLNNLQVKKLPIDPYVLGVWFGDGHSASGYVTNMYEELFEEIKKRGYFVGENVDKTGHCGKAKTRCLFGLQKQLRESSLLKNKHIPEEYIINTTVEQRWDLLKGIMDTDGTYNKTRNSFVITTKDLNLAESYCKLICSLGIKPSLIKYKAQCKTCKKIYYDSWYVSFITEDYPFLIRKINVKGKCGNARHIYRNIVSVEEVETVPTKCIEVDSDTHTYLAGENLLVTHNTNADIYKDYSRNWDVMMLEPFSHFYEEPFSHYAIQLSLYQIPLMNLGIEVVDRNLIWLKDNKTYEKVKTPDLTKELMEII